MDAYTAGSGIRPGADMSFPPLNLLVAAAETALPDQLQSLLRQAGHDVRLEAVADMPRLTERLPDADLVILYGVEDDSPQALTMDAVLAAMRLQQMTSPLLYSPAPGESRDRSALLQAGVEEVIAGDAPAVALQAVERTILSLRQQQEVQWLRRRVRDLETDNSALRELSAEPTALIEAGIHRQCNPAYRRFWGIDDSVPLHDITLQDLVHEDDRAALQAFLSPLPETPVSATFRLQPGLMKAGGAAETDTATTLFRFRPVDHEGQACLELRLSPAPGNASHAQRLDNLRNRDPVTHLDNREALSLKLEAAIRKALQGGPASILLKVSLDNLNEQETGLNRGTINRLLRDIGQFLRQSVTRPLSAARIDATSFALLLPDNSLQDIRELADFIRSSISTRFSTVGAQHNALGCRIGIARVNQHTADAGSLLALADLPLPAGDAPQAESPAGESSATGDTDLMAYVGPALEGDRLRLLFQPIVSLKGDDSFRGYEVFTRLLDEHDNDIAPHRFLPALNFQGLGERLDQQVIRALLDTLGRTPETSPSLTLNLTATTLMRGTLADWLSEQLAVRQLDPSRLIVALSEIDLQQHPNRVLAMASGLRSLGVGISLKHFGLALDTFRYLDELNPVFIALDNRLIRDLAYNDAHRDNIRQMLQRLHDRQLLVAAPNIEDMDLLPLLWETGFDLAQGYCLQRPSQDMDYDFIEEEEITLDSLPGQ